MIFLRSSFRVREWEYLCFGFCFGRGLGRSLGLALVGDSVVLRRFWSVGWWVGRFGRLVG